MRLAPALAVVLLATRASAADDPDVDAALPAASIPVAVPVVAVSRVYDLRRCVALAERNYPKVHEAQARLQRMNAELWQAQTAPFSDFTMTGGVGLAPTVRGTALYSPDTDATLTSSMALAWQVGVDGTVPLWTFGKIASTWDAARAQIHVGEHDVKKEKNLVRLSVHKAYFGLQLSRDALELVRTAMRRVDKYAKRLAERVTNGEGDEIQLLKLQMNRAELDARESEAMKQEAVALASLRFLTGAKGAFDVPDRPLKKVPHVLGPLANYLGAARLFRPEINMVRAGVLARQAQVDIERARYYPDIALGLSARWASAPEVVDQTNPFVRDDANYLRYGAALVMRWKLDFLPTAAREAQAEAQLEEIRATERYALGGVALEVEQAYQEARDAERRLNAWTRATGYAKRWLIKVQQAIDIGTSEDEDVVDPAKEYALKRYSQMSATYDYDLAIAQLGLATGWDALLRE